MDQDAGAGKVERATLPSHCEDIIGSHSSHMLTSKLNRITALAGGLAAALLCSTAPGRAIDGPSFDCSHGVNSVLATILCKSSDAARADWDLSSASWASSPDDREQNAFNQSMRERCGLSLQGVEQVQIYGLPVPIPVPLPQPITEAHVRCVVNAFNNRTAMLRARLTGDALIESQLTPEAHIAIQQALLGKGLLNSRVLKFGAKPDGQFGPNTRAAIQEYQRSVGAKPTGFLSDQQRLALLETPEEVKARAARAAAEAQARQATLDAWKQTEERAKRDEERARQAALDAKKQAEEQAKRDEEQRLEEEAAKAAEWRQKIEEAQKKGPDYATKVSDMKWTLNQHANPMTEEIDYSASSMQTNGSGAAASVDGFCRNDQVLFQATLENATDPKLPLGFITSPYGGGIVGKKRLNDGAVMPTEFPAEKWRNRITLSTLAFSHDAAEGAETTWRILAEIETSHGTLYVKIPMFNVSIQKLVSNCQQLYEREKQRGGRPDAPASRP